MNYTKVKLFPKNIYVYNKPDDTKGLCVYICDTDNSNEIIVGSIEDVNPLNNNYLKMDNGLKKVLYLDRYLTLKTSQIEAPFYFSGKPSTINSEEFLHLTTSVYKLMILNFQMKIEKLSNNNFYDGKLEDITLPEKIIKLLNWNLKKSDLRFTTKSNNIVVMEHCIYFAYLGTNIGCEIEKLRPVLIWRKHINKQNSLDDSFYVFPITSKSQRKSYSTNIEIDINGKKNFIKLNQGKVISRQRIYKIYENRDNGKVYKINNSTIEKIKNSLKEYFGI